MPDKKVYIWTFNSMSHLEGHMYNERIKLVHIDMVLPNGHAHSELRLGV